LLGKKSERYTPHIAIYSLHFVNSEEAKGQQDEPKGALGYLKKGFNSVVGAAKSIGQKTGEKLEEAKIGEKMKKAGSAIAEGTKTAGIFIYDKALVAVDKISEKGKEIRVQYY